MTLLLCLLIFLPKILTGFVIANLLWKDSDFPAVALKLALGVPLGFGLSASLFFLALLVGVLPSTYAQIEFWSMLILIGALMVWGVPAWKQYWNMPTLSREDLWGAGIVLFGAALSGAAFLYYAQLHPYGFEDAWSMWNSTARFIYRSNSADVIFNSPLYERFHPDYPLEHSLNVAWGWLFLKDETTRLPIAVALLANFSPAIVLWAALRKWKGVLPAAFGTLALVMLPNLASGVGQYADALVTLHMLAAVVSLYGYLRTNQVGLLVLAGYMAGSAGWVKNEGLLFLVVFGMVCAFVVRRQVGQWKDLKWFVAGMLPALVIVFLYKYTIGWQNDLFGAGSSSLAQLLDVSRWLQIGQNFFTYLLRYGNWPISALLILAVYAMLVGVEKQELWQQWWLFLILAFQLAGYYFIYLITPHDLSLHIQTSIDRLLSHIYPLLIAWIFTVTRAPDLISSRRSDPRPQTNIL